MRVKISGIMESPKWVGRIGEGTGLENQRTNVLGVRVPHPLLNLKENYERT